MTETLIDEVKADGGTRRMDKAKLDALKHEFQQLCKDAGQSVNDRRELAEDTRFCRWEGQSRDGKKHADAQDGKPAFPYEGASDARVRVADGIVNEQVMIVMAAIMRAQLGFKGTERNDDEYAANMNTLWQWVLRNQLGREWFVEWTKAIQWRQGDSPGLGIMQVYWCQRTELKPQTVDQAGVLERAAAAAAQDGVQLAPEDMADWQDLAANVAREEEFAEFLQALWPEMPDARATKVARQIQVDGEATFPYPIVVEDRLAVKARRLFHDIFIPENTGHDLQKARVIYVTEWPTKVDLEERVGKGELTEGFVKQVLEHEGKSGWQHYSRLDAAGDYSESIQPRQDDANRRRGTYELITAFYRATNADGVPGLYKVTYHHAVDEAGTEEELCDWPIGYPFVPIPREILNDNLWDVRGVSELSMTEQESLKLLHDSFMDHAQLTTVPPLKVPMNRPRMQLVIGPLKQIKEQRPGDISWMSPPAYPATNDKVQDGIVRRLDRYFGRISPENPPDLVRLYQQWLVDFVLLDQLEVIRMGMKLVLHYLPDEKLQRVTGENGQPIAQTTEDLSFDFDLEASFEAGMLSFEFLKAVGEMITNYVLQWDTVSTVKRDELVRWFFSALSPSLARRALTPVQAANQSEVDDEERNFLKLKAGIEPPMMTEGQNFGLRLSVLLGIGERNPEAVATLTPKSREIYEARVKHLYGQVEQQKNAVIGKTMARPALEQGPPV